MLNVIRFLLLPFSWVYGLVVILRNFLYNKGVLKSHAFDLPVIVVGNLEVGGSGKTPVIEYLIRLLKDKCRIAVLSRGYGRETTGFIRAHTGSGPSADDAAGEASRSAAPMNTVPTSAAPMDDAAGNAPMSAVPSAVPMSAARIGDEPFQYFSKFSDITVAVDADRVAAIRELKADHDAILLDDAFQHRRLAPGLSILVLDYNTLFRPRFLLPAGNYREPFSGRKRASVLLVSKAPRVLSPAERQRIIQRLAPAAGQPVCFSSLEYDELKALDAAAAQDPAAALPADDPAAALFAADLRQTELSSRTHVLLLTGIARPGPLVSHVKKITPHVIHVKYPDHHSYTVKNIAKIAEVFEGIDSRDKIILTTEKDAARLRGEELKGMLVQLPVFYWPVRIKIHEPDRNLFNGKILEYVKSGASRLN